MASSGRMVMEKQGQEVLLQQQAPLKCPRCDSSNTKFCYYNNYSLSQPRHFCKACKRYWTRGGTLRNVPVGGGCRKNNKRALKLQRQLQTTNSNSSNIDTCITSPSSPSISHSANSSHQSQINNPNLFYGLGLLPSSNSCDVMMNHVSNFPRYNDLHPQMNSAIDGIFMSSDNNGYQNGGFVSGSGSDRNSNTLLSTHNNSIFGSSSSSAPANPVMASLLSSTLLQQKFFNASGGSNISFHGLAPLEGMDASREVKGGGEGQNSMLEWKNNNNNNTNDAAYCQNLQIEQMGFSDPSLYNWNTTTMGAWSSDHEPNIGPSVTSLI